MSPGPLDPDDTLAAAIKTLQGVDYTAATEEALARFVDALSRVLGRASVAHHEKRERRLRHVQEDDPAFTPVWPPAASAQEGRPQG